MKSVTIYSTPTCGYCQQLKQFLKANSIPYTDHDVTTDEAALQEMQKISGGSLSVPVIVFDKGQLSQEVQIGYDVGKVRTTLGL